MFFRSSVLLFTTVQQNHEYDLRNRNMFLSRSGQHRCDAGLGLFVLENILLVRVRNTFFIS